MIWDGTVPYPLRGLSPPSLPPPLSSPPPPPPPRSLAPQPTLEWLYFPTPASRVLSQPLTSSPTPYPLSLPPLLPTHTHTHTYTLLNLNLSPHPFPSLPFPLSAPFPSLPFPLSPPLSLSSLPSLSPLSLSSLPSLPTPFPLFPSFSPHPFPSLPLPLSAPFPSLSGPKRTRRSRGHWLTDDCSPSTLEERGPVSDLLTARACGLKTCLPLLSPLSTPPPVAMVGQALSPGVSEGLGAVLRPYCGLPALRLFPQHRPGRSAVQHTLLDLLLYPRHC